MRTIALVDLDCFYAQVEQREKPELWGKPVAVVQYAREGAYGGIIALSYEAKAAGVRRGMFLPEAQAACAELQVAYVPSGEHIDKADIQKYRDASAEVFQVLNNIDPRIIVERASIDEAFLDMSAYVQEIYDEIEDKEEYMDQMVNEVETAMTTTHLADGNDVNHDNDEEFDYQRDVNLMEWLHESCRNDPIQYRLAIATVTIERVRADVRRLTQFYCSAGIGNNKTLAKLVCARHKPRQQTVIPLDAVPDIFRYTPIESVRGLGGKLGQSLMDSFKIKTMWELSQLNYDQLVEMLPGCARWLWHLAKGIDKELVKPRNTQTSIAVGKNFPGKNALATVDEVRRWVDGLSKELAKRLISDQMRNSRTAENLVISFHNPAVVTRTLKLNSYNAMHIFNMVWAFMRNFNKAKQGAPQWEPPLLLLSFSASKFNEGVAAETKSILQWIVDSVQMPDPENLGKKPSTSNAPPEPPALDADGWQIFDPTKLDDTPGPPPEIMEMGHFQVAKEIFDELPEFIKAELEHEQRLTAQRKLLEAEKENARAKAAAAAAAKGGAATTTGGKGKKRGSKAPPAKKEPPPKKTIDSFFKKT